MDTYNLNNKMGSYRQKLDNRLRYNSHAEREYKEHMWDSQGMPRHYQHKDKKKSYQNDLGYTFEHKN